MFSPAVKPSPEMVLTNNVLGSVAVISAIDLTIALVPDVAPVIVFPTKLLKLTVVPEYVEFNLIEVRVLSNKRAPPVTIDPLVNIC